MADVEKLIKAGGTLGFSGQDLQDWVTRQLEDHEKHRQDDLEKLKMEKEKIWEKQQLVEKELELERLRLESQAASPTPTPNSTPSGFRSVSTRPLTKSPRLPCFDEKIDQVDSYLLRFERYASVNGWDRSDWAIHLSALLKGKALEVYTRLDDDEAQDYDKCREALLKRYNLTQDGFQEKFRKSRPEVGERIGQFRIRLQSYLDKWVQLAGKDKMRAEDLMDLILMEQLYSSCAKDLVVFLKERKPRSADEIVELADKYVDAHGQAGAFSKASLEKKDFRPQGPNQRDLGTTQCHRCKRFGHIEKYCKVKAVSAVETKKCTYCRKMGHTEEQCGKKEDDRKQKGTQKCGNVECGTETPAYVGHCPCKDTVISAACTGHVQVTQRMPTAVGYLDGRKVTVLRDSGCSCVVIRKGLSKRVANGQKLIPLNLADGTTINAPATKANIDCPFYTGEVEVVEMQSPIYDVILGNIPGAKCPGIALHEESMAVETRNQSQKSRKALLTPAAANMGVTVVELIEKQQNDSSLERCRRWAQSGAIRLSGKQNKAWFGYEKGILVRYIQSPVCNFGDVTRQVVVPEELRNTVMQLGHECIMAGHLAAAKTTDRISQEFYWPQIWEDVAHFCRSCDQCQRSAPKGKTSKVPLSEIPLIDEPFSRIAVDLVGPIIPASEKGNRYILTVVDYCTRYPEAIPLKNIDTETVAEALVDIFSRTGVPKEMLSDRGTQFTSELMNEVCRLLSVRRLTTSAYHPQCNGLVERFNSTLKGMLKRLASDRPKDWDRYINAALFAYREAPQESLGFSPFELLYARPVRGPMTILRELWTENIEDEEIKTTYQYVIDLREKMEKVIEVAQENLKNASKRYKKYFDVKAKARTFDKGDKVLLLLPTKANKLQLKWQGPFEIIRKNGENNYVIEIGKVQRTYHANMLRKYWDREVTGSSSEQVGVLECAVAAFIDEEEDTGELQRKGLSIETLNLRQSETFRDVHMGEELDDQQKQEMLSVLKEFEDVLSDVPGRTSAYVYDIKLTSSTPVRRKPYPTPQALQAEFRKEVQAMLEAGIIEPSDSPYSSPPVIVKKKDGTNRYCVDFRQINNISVFDAEPMPRLDELFQQIGTESRYVSKIDLCKGYWQVPLSEGSKPITAFPTDLGLMQFKVMPFGLQCAPAAFSRLMRKVLKDVPGVKNYIDDIVIHSSTWNAHLQSLRTVLDKLREAGLTAKPSKCTLANRHVEFLGHKIGSGTLSPTIDKVEAIRQAKQPQNKTQMRSFIGLASFYRRYVPNFAAITSPLTDATRKNMPNRIAWGEPQQRAFDKLKSVLTTEPVLHLPDFERQFILAVDASDTGLGAVLMQESEGEKCPIIYLSRKLLPREQNYSVVEKECLALVWAVKSLSTYLIGREFVVETDHAPLLYLNRAKSENGRLMRWALLLSQYRFNLRSVRGSENYGPDFLSRSN